MLRMHDRENVGKVLLSTEEYEDSNSFHGELDVSSQNTQCLNLYVLSRLYMYNFKLQHVRC